jgi:hypothetical protein
MSLLVLARISVDETVDASRTESGRGDTLAFCTSPWTGFLAAAEGFNGTGDDGSFGGLLPLLRLASASAAAARTRAIAAASAVAIVMVCVSVAIITTVVPTRAGAGSVAVASDCADDSAQAC